MTRPSSFSKGAGVWALGILLAGMFLFMLRHFQSESRQSRERNAYACLVTLAKAEQDYRDADRDGNGIKDFWTGDVAGLFKFGKIPKELAEADASPLHPLVPKPIPYKGYLFRALVLDRSEPPPVPYSQETDRVSGKVHNLGRYGFIAFPADPSEGKYFYIVNENNTIFPSAYIDKIPFDWPTDDDLKQYYIKY